MTEVFIKRKQNTNQARRKKQKDNELQFVINDSHFAKVIVKANGPGPTEEGRGDGEQKAKTIGASFS